jgi:hypothetical protein
VIEDISEYVLFYCGDYYYDYIFNGKYRKFRKKKYGKNKLRFGKKKKSRLIVLRSYLINKNI